MRGKNRKLIIILLLTSIIVMIIFLYGQNMSSLVPPINNIKSIEIIIDNISKSNTITLNKSQIEEINKLFKKTPIYYHGLYSYIDVDDTIYRLFIQEKNDKITTLIICDNDVYNKFLHYRTNDKKCKQIKKLLDEVINKAR